MARLNRLTDSDPAASDAVRTNKIANPNLLSGVDLNRGRKLNNSPAPPRTAHIPLLLEANLSVSQW